MGVMTSRKVPPSDKDKEVNIGWMTANQKKCTVLCRAVLSKCARSVEMVISKGVDLDEQNSANGMTAVHLAVYLNLTDVVKVLVENGVNVNIPDKEGTTPLICVIKQDNIEMAKKLLTAGADPLKSDGDGNSALHYAARYSASSVELLLSLGVNVNIPNKNCNTPLMCAIKEKQIEIVEQLLSRGAGPLIPDCRGATALHYAARYCVKSIELLLSKGVNVNIPDKRRVTPLMVAIKEGNVEIVKQLLNGGAELLRRDYRGETALHYATKYSTGSVEPLLSNIVNVNIADKESITPLMIAIKKENIEVVKLLLNKGGKPLLADCHGETALHYAARYSAKSVELMLSKGVDVDVIAQCHNLRDRRTPLMAATDAGNMSTLILLLNNGADVSLRSGDFQTAMHFAKSGRVVEILWEWGADINAWDMDGKTPLHSASKREKLEVIEAMLAFGPPPPDYGSFIRRSCSPWLVQSVNKIMMKFKQAYYNHITYATLDVSDISNSDKFISQCSLEVKRLKEARFGRLSLFHMLIRGLTDCSFAANAGMCEFVENDQLKQDFPLYHGILRRHLRIAKRRHCLISDLVDKFTSIVKRNFPNVLLPEEVGIIILTQLSTADMIRFNRTLDRDFMIGAEAEDIVQQK